MEEKDIEGKDMEEKKMGVDRDDIITDVVKDYLDNNDINYNVNVRELEDALKEIYDNNDFEKYNLVDRFAMIKGCIVQLYWNTTRENFDCMLEALKDKDTCEKVLKRFKMYKYRPSCLMELNSIYDKICELAKLKLMYRNKKLIDENIGNNTLSNFGELIGRGKTFGFGNECLVKEAYVCYLRDIINKDWSLEDDLIKNAFELLNRAVEVYEKIDNLEDKTYEVYVDTKELREEGTRILGEITKYVSLIVETKGINIAELNKWYRDITNCI